MRIDATQRGWAIGSIAILLVSAAAYAVYGLNYPRELRGGSPVGIMFGVVGLGFMVFAGLLGARKRVPTWRLGRAKAWMRGHLWLGALSLPMILFHGGFRFGGTLTGVLMCLLIVTVLSGFLGAALQHYVPKLMTADVPLETIYEEIGSVRKLLCSEADTEVEAICGSLGNGVTARSGVNNSLRAGGFTALRAMTPGGGQGPTAVAVAPTIAVLTEEESAPLRRFYLNEVRPFLSKPAERRLILADANRAQVAFAGLRTLLPSSVHATLDDLIDICDEARQLRKQEKLHRWLHGWLLVHIPMSIAVILLGAIHAVVALRY